jgi:hypothetical protein
LREETAHPDEAHNTKLQPLKSRKNPTQKLHIKERIHQQEPPLIIPLPSSPWIPG